MKFKKWSTKNWFFFKDLFNFLIFDLSYQVIVSQKVNTCQFQCFSKSFALILIFFDHFFAVLGLFIPYLHLQKAFFIILKKYITGISLSVSDKNSALIGFLCKFDLLLVSRFFELSGSTIILELEKTWFLFSDAFWAKAHLIENCII